MPLFLAAVAAILAISAIRGTLTTSGSTPGLFTLIIGDFTGQNNFLIWLAAIVGIGAIGYIKPIKPVANAFLGLVILVLFLSHKGFFAQFVSAAESTQSAGSGTTTSTSVQPIVLTPFQPVNLAPTTTLGTGLSTAIPNVLIGG